MKHSSLFCILIFIFHIFGWTEARVFIRDDNIEVFQNSKDDLFFARHLDEKSYDTHQAVKTLKLHGSISLGYYFTTLYFGTPPQRQTLIVDTGSTVTTVPCSECQWSCGANHLSEFFNPGQSETFQEMQCREQAGNYVCSNCADMCSFSIKYSEGSSYYGKYKKDYVSFDAPAKVLSQNRSLLSTDTLKTRTLDIEGDSDQTAEENDTDDIDSQIITEPAKEEVKIFMPFGCTLRETNLFLTQEADGILGLGVHTDNVQTPPNIFDFLHKTNSSIPNAFSICMGPTGGYLSAGGYNTTYHSSSDVVKYVPYDGSRGQYKIYWKSIKFEGRDLDVQENILNDGRGAYVDSGTTLLYTTTLISEVINDALSTFCRESREHCGGNHREDFCWVHDPNKYPNIEDFFGTFGTFTFQFGQNEVIDYEWRPQDYLFRYADDMNYYCIGMDKIDGKRTIFGGSFMRNHDVLFDKTNKRLGFIRSDCSAEYSLSDYPTAYHPRYDFNGGSSGKFKDVFIAFTVLGIIGVIVCLGIKWKKRHDTQKKISNVELGMSGDRSVNPALDTTKSKDFQLLVDDENLANEAEDQYAV